MSTPRGFSSTVAHRLGAAGEPDFYPTPPWAARAGGELIATLDPDIRVRAIVCWEPACGAGHMAHGLRDYFYRVAVSDAYSYGDNPIFDFTSDAPVPHRVGWIVTNPPFGHVETFIRRAWARADRGVAMLCRLALLETIDRHRLLYRDCPLAVVAPFAERVCMTKGRWEPEGSTASAYAWFVWLKPGMPRPAPEPVVRPIPPGTMARLSRPTDEAFAARAA
ncbi:MAG: hypothetical protein KGL39_43350 [Patescibacteria group bacterium]|nr:hypothetical protein [Patescibacteria group bacterium]